MKQLLSPAPLNSYQPGMALVRIITGLLMAYHGWEIFDTTKMDGYTKWLTDLRFPQPALMAYLGKLAELVSGILLTLGLFTRLAVWPLILTMLGITFGMGKGKVWYEDQHPFLFVLIGIVFFLAGGGRYSLDQALFGKK